MWYGTKSFAFCITLPLIPWTVHCSCYVSSVCLILVMKYSGYSCGLLTTSLLRLKLWAHGIFNCKNYVARTWPFVLWLLQCINATFWIWVRWLTHVRLIFRTASISAKQQSEHLVKQASGSSFGHSSYGQFQSGFSRGCGHSKLSGNVLAL